MLTVYDVLDRYAAERGRDYSSARAKDGYNQFVSLWQSFYKGEIQGVNISAGWNGEQIFPIKRESMKVAKLICQKWAALLMGEAFTITLAETEQDKWNELEKITDFRSKLNKALTFAYAEGSCCLLAGAELEKNKETGEIIGGKPKLDVIRYSGIFPLVYDVNDISEMAFIREQAKQDYVLYTISIHRREGNQTTVENFTAEVKNDTVTINTIDKVEDIQTYENPLYCFLKPNTPNDFTETLPFGASIFSDSLASIGGVDLAADLMSQDLINGNQLTFAGKDMLTNAVKAAEAKDKTAANAKNEILTNTRNKIFFIPQELQMQGSDIKQLFQQHIPEIRSSEIWEALKNNLQWSTYTAGLGKQGLDIIPHTTATGQIQSEQEKMASKALHEQYLQGQLEFIIRALCEMSGLTGTPIDSTNIGIVFEDQIIVDTAEDKRVAILEVDNGLMSKAEYRVHYYGETLEAAQAKIDEIAAGKMFNATDLFTPADIEAARAAEAAQTIETMTEGE